MPAGLWQQICGSRAVAAGLWQLRACGERASWHVTRLALAMSHAWSHGAAPDGMTCAPTPALPHLLLCPRLMQSHSETQEEFLAGQRVRNCASLPCRCHAVASGCLWMQGMEHGNACCVSNCACNVPALPQTAAGPAHPADPHHGDTGQAEQGHGCGEGRQQYW